MLKREKYNKQQASRAERIVDILLNGGNVPPEDLDRIRRWFADGGKADEKAAAFEKEFSEAFRYEENPEYMPQMWADIAQRLGFDTNHARAMEIARQAGKGVGMPLRRRVAVRAAAVLIPFFVAAAATGLLLFRTGGPASDSLAGRVTVAASAGDGTRQSAATVILTGNTTHILPDNSTVRLEPGSELRYAGTFDGGRHVELRGGAHFNVTKAKNKGDRFTVHTDYLDVTVLGTEFEVHSPAGVAHSTIDLYHGSVEVRSGIKTVTMRPTDHLSYDHLTRETAVTTIPYGQLRYDGMPGMEFDKTPIADVFAKLESDFGVRFSIEGDISREQTVVNGSFTSFGALGEVMSVMQKISGNFDYEITDSEIRIKLNNIQ